MTITLSLSDVEDLTLRALGACNTGDANARSVAASVVASEADGIHSHGLARLPTYCEHARCGKIDGQAVPEMEEVAAAGLKVDARDGFAHPAIDLGLPALTALAKASSSSPSIPRPLPARDLPPA
jgi:(2R)-3-sulfolactate dehydrogenase (NADP+)